MSKAKLTFQSALWNHAGKILEYVLMYATSIVIARGLGVQENGRFVGLFAFSQLLLVLCSFGLETSLNKFIPQLSEEKTIEKARFILRRALGIRVLAFFGVAAVVYVAVLLLAIPFFEASGKVLLIVFMFTGVRSLFPLFVTVLTAHLNTALVARINLFIRLLEIIAIVVLARLDFTVRNVFIIFLGTSVLHVLAYTMFSRKNLLGKTETVDMKPIITFGSIFWVNTIVDFILGRQGDVLFLTNLMSDSSQAGLYDVAYSVAQLASFAMTVGLSGITLATFARLAMSNQQTMDRFYSFSIRIISLLTIPLYAFLLFNGEPVLSTLYAPQYLPATVLIQGILMFRVASRLFGGAENAEYLLSHGKVKFVVGFGLLAATANILLNIVLIPRFGAMGSVLASGCGNLLVNVLSALAVYKISPNRMQASFWLKTTVICVVSSLVVSVVVSREGLGSLALAGVVYMTLLGVGFLFVKPLTDEDSEWLTRVDDRVRKPLAYFAR